MWEPRDPLLKVLTFFVLFSDVGYSQRVCGLFSPPRPGGRGEARKARYAEGLGSTPLRNGRGTCALWGGLAALCDPVRVR
jgi:hypothetical protein